MKTSVEKGLAFHSSIMVALQGLTNDSEKGLAIVSSKRTLRRLRKISKNHTTKGNGSNSYTSDEELFKLPLKRNQSNQTNPEQVGLLLSRWTYQKWTLKLQVPQQTERPRNHQVRLNMIMSVKVFHATSFQKFYFSFKGNWSGSFSYTFKFS